MGTRLHACSLLWKLQKKFAEIHTIFMWILYTENDTCMLTISLCRNNESVNLESTVQRLRTTSEQLEQANRLQEQVSVKNTAWTKIVFNQCLFFLATTLIIQDTDLWRKCYEKTRWPPKLMTAKRTIHRVVQNYAVCTCEINPFMRRFQSFGFVS